MTQMMEQAMKEVAKLPDGQQDALAALLFEEIADENRWQETFAKSQSQLAKVAAKVREDIQAGRVRPGGIDEL